LEQQIIVVTSGPSSSLRINSVKNLENAIFSSQNEIRHFIQYNKSVMCFMLSVVAFEMIENRQPGEGKQTYSAYGRMRGFPGEYFISSLAFYVYQ